MKFSILQRRRQFDRMAGIAVRYAIEALEERTLLNSYIVTNTDNSGNGSFRDAIQQANANPGLDIINFNIALGGVQTIKPTFALPQIIDPVEIHGETESGYAGQPLIELDGSLAGNSIGLEFRVGGNLVKGLDIHSFALDGIVFAEPTGPHPTGGNTAIANSIGTDPTGTLAEGNGQAGIHLVYSPHDLIKNNLLSGNKQSGIFVGDQFSTDTHIEGNLIGTDITGIKALGNELDGVSLAAPPIPMPGDGFASGNFVGGIDSDQRNIIAGNLQSGILIQGGTGNSVLGNYIGVGKDGITPLPNGAITDPTKATFGIAGVLINGASSNVIGGTVAAALNLISANAGDGVELISGAASNTIQGNLIGTKGNGVEPLPNGRDGVALFDASGNSIGGTVAGARNIIAGNKSDGVYLGAVTAPNGSVGNQVFGNYIGLDDLGFAVPNGQDGVEINDSANNIIGGDSAGARNVISGNTMVGVEIVNLSHDNQVIGNYLGADEDGEFVESDANLFAGVGIDGSNNNIVKGNTIRGNPVGVGIINSATGNSLFANIITNSSGNGISIKSGASNNMIGGPSLGEPNRIGTDDLGDFAEGTGNTGAGIDINGAVNNTVQNNDIRGNGTGVLLENADTQGNFLLGNSITNSVGDGVQISSGASGNTIGGTNAGDVNLISANSTVGVEILSLAHDNQVVGNDIGTDENGQFVEGAGNLFAGVGIDGANTNTVQGNAIRGNSVGISIIDSGTGNSLFGNIITNSSGSAITIKSGASKNMIGGSADGQGNYIGTDDSGEFAADDGNAGAGVDINGAGNNTIQNNTIRGNGTGVLIENAAAQGNSLLGNTITNSAGDGVQITNGASGNAIGGSTAADRNVISANATVGVEILSLAHDNQIVGNYLGTDDNGKFADGQGNLFAGVGIDGANTNTIQGNTIRGNPVGISIIDGGMGNNLFGNIITNSSGNAVTIKSGALKNMIGGAAAGQGNDIGTDDNGQFAAGSGNAGAGVDINGGVGNTVQNNAIRGNGTGVLLENAGTQGNSLLGNTITNNTGDGVQIAGGASGNTIGGANVSDRNIISRNAAVGVEILSLSHDNKVIGNYLGTDENGQFVDSDGNLFAGVGIDGANTNTIQGNTIRGNPVGISIIDGGMGNSLLANIITNSSGNGITIKSGASNNVIGGPSVGSGNSISLNAGAGVFVDSGTGNAILHNLIFSNGGLGIDLAPQGVTFNDQISNKDADTGANNLQNFPVLMMATTGGSQRIVGTLSSAANSTFILEFFYLDNPDPSGYGQGDRYLTTAAVITNASGVAQFDVALPAGVLPRTFISATATDAVGNTSEFSKVIMVEPDTDGDGISDDAEGSIDGNDDGVPDYQQANVASFPDAVSGQFVTLQSAAGTTFSNVAPLTNPSPDDAPDASFDLGFFSFTVNGVTPGSADDVQLFLPAGSQPLYYERYGPVVGSTDPNPHWYGWRYNGETGAEINGNQVTLHFIDGQFGDDDLTANGSITDPGGLAFPDRFTVTNTNDSGPGSLRQAILNSNGHFGNDIIDFHIGSGVQTIVPLSSLPTILFPVDIDGTTQPGFAGKPIIQISGQSAPGSGLVVNAPDTTIRGFVINGFSAAGISDIGILGGSVSFVPPIDDDLIAGNYIGTDITGLLPRPNFVGIATGGLGLSEIQIGGTSPADRNVISGNLNNGINITGGNGLSIEGNYIGVGADGVTPLGNGNDGIRDNPGAYLGQETQGLVIGGLDAATGNVIAYNTLNGIDSAVSALHQFFFDGHAFLSNSIHDNGILGIAFNSDFVNLNDTGLTDGSYSDPQNYPILGSAISSGGQTTIAGYLNSKANSTFLIQFFSNPKVLLSGFGQGQTYLGSTSVTTDANGHVDFTATFNVAVANKNLITATATDSLNETSEFSPRLSVGDVLGNVYIVNTTDDLDHGFADSTHTSLREAIFAADNHPGPDTILFDIPGGGVQTLAPLTPLPQITDAVTIDGTSQPGFAGTPLIQIVGTSMELVHLLTSTTPASPPSPSASVYYLSGLVVLGDNSTIRGLDINSFFQLRTTSIQGGGMPLTVDGNNNVIEGNFIGTDVTGTIARPNLQGIVVSGQGNRIGGTTPAQRNIISGNFGTGLTVSIGGTTNATATPNLIEGNFIGTDITGTKALGNGSGPSSSGVTINYDNILGGSAPGAGNVISANLGTGVVLNFAAGSVIQGNFIGTDVTGTKILGNTAGGDGIDLNENVFPAPTLGTTIGGTLPGQRNIISNNRVGIFIGSGFADVIQGNFIGTDITGTLDFGNSVDGIDAGGDKHIIGGTAPGAGNLISGNNRFGILLLPAINSSGNVVQGNRIGTQADGVSPLGNSSDGIAVATDFTASTSGTGPINDLIGGVNSGAGNIIAFNGGRGVNILAGQQIAVLSNSIYSNASLGIDLNGDGVTANDSKDVDAGDNNLQNFPVLATVVTDGERTTVTGTFNGAPSTAFMLQFFASSAADASGFGEGQTFLGTRQIITDAAGNATFTMNFPVSVPNGQFISATATDPLNNTSEFSSNLQLVNGTVAPNQPPNATISGTYTINEGDPLTLDASLSADPDGDPLTISWDLNGDGVFGDAAGAKPSLSWAQLQALGIIDGPSSFNIKVRVDDGQGHVVTSPATTLTILNVAPTASVGPDVFVTENDQVALTGTFTDPGTADTFTFDWHVVVNNGQHIPDGTSQNFSFVPPDNGNYVVTFTVTDDDGASSSATLIVFVANAAPVATILGAPAQSAIGFPISVTSSVTDVSPVDTAAGFSYSWDAALVGNNSVVFFGSSPNFSFTPTLPGTYFVFLSARDKDGGSAFVNTKIIVPFVVTSASFTPGGSGNERLTIAFDHAAPPPILSLADFTVQDAKTGQVIDPTTMSLAFNIASETAVITFPGLTDSHLPDGRYTLTIPGANYTFNFFRLIGDATQDATVGFSDLIIVAQDYNKTGAQLSWSDGDFNGDGKVDFADLVALAQNYGRSLAPIPAATAILSLPAPATALMSSLAIAQPMINPEPEIVSPTQPAVKGQIGRFSTARLPAPANKVGLVKPAHRVIVSSAPSKPTEIAPQASFASSTPSAPLSPFYRKKTAHRAEFMSDDQPR